MTRGNERDIKVTVNIVAATLIYAFLAIVTKPYGDPFTVIRTSQNIGLYGFPFDPVSRSVRAPLYYYLLFIAGDYYMFFQSLLSVVNVVLLARIAVKLNVRPSAISFMLPGLYLLLTRTYVDSLTVMLLSLLILSAFSFLNIKSLTFKAYTIILLSFLLVLNRESMSLLPLLPLVMLTLRPPPILRRRLFILTILLLTGWGLGYLTYYLYVRSVGAAPYSSYRLYNIRLEDFYVAYTYMFSSIVPWEVRAGDLSQYIFFVKLSNSTYIYLAFVVKAIIIILQLLISVPFIIGLIRLFITKHANVSQYVASSFIIFGLLLAGMLFLVKQPIDFFKYTCGLLPFTSYLIASGLNFIEKHSKIVCRLIESSYVLMLSLWILRVLRTYCTI